MSMYSESPSKVKVALLTVNTFPNYAYVSSYFELKSFPWKRRLDNISKQTNGETLGKTIFETPYGVLHFSFFDVK